MIGDDIAISVLSVTADKIRLGINAPRQTPVYRRGLYRALHRDTDATSSARAEVDHALQQLVTPATPDYRQHRGGGPLDSGTAQALKGDH